MALITRELPVRKSFLLAGAAIVAVAVLGFVLSAFVLGGSGSPDATETVAAPSTNSSVQAPATSAEKAPVAAFPRNVLRPGGANPFTRKAAGVRPQAAADPAPAASAPEPGSQPSLNAVNKTAKRHTWQLLDFEGGKATFLVDGKKIANLSPGDKIVDGYSYNSVTGECVTVKKAAVVFGLCPGAAPFAQ